MFRPVKIHEQPNGNQSAVRKCIDVMHIYWQVNGGCDWLLSNTHRQTSFRLWLGDWESETCFWWLDITKATTYKASGASLSDCIPSIICELCQCFAAAPLMEESEWIVWRKDEEGTPSQQNVNILSHYWLEMPHETTHLCTLLCLPICHNKSVTNINFMVSLFFTSLIFSLNWHFMFICLIFLPNVRLLWASTTNVVRFIKVNTF